MLLNLLGSHFSYSVQSFYKSQYGFCLIKRLLIIHNSHNPLCSQTVEGPYVTAFEHAAVLCCWYKTSHKSTALSNHPFFMFYKVYDHCCFRFTAQSMCTVYMYVCVCVCVCVCVRMYVGVGPSIPTHLITCDMFVMCLCDISVKYYILLRGMGLILMFIVNWSAWFILLTQKWYFIIPTLWMVKEGIFYQGKNQFENAEALHTHRGRQQS